MILYQNKQLDRINTYFNVQLKSSITELLEFGNKQILLKHFKVGVI